MIEPASIRIVRAGPQEARTLLALLPEMALSPTLSDIYVALLNGTFLGGAVLMPEKEKRNGQQTTGFRLALVEEAPQIVGEMLIHALKVIARRDGFELLLHTAPVLEEGDLAGMLDRCHFLKDPETITHYRVPVDAPRLQHVEQVYRNLQARGRLPTAARISPLHQLAAAPVMELLLRNVGAEDAGFGHDVLLHESYSTGIQIGSEVVGVHVATRRENEARTTHIAIDPRMRGAWIFAALIAETRARIRADGCQTWLFKMRSSYTPAARHFAAKLPVTCIATEHPWFFPLT